MSKSPRAALMAGEREKLSEALVIRVPHSVMEWLKRTSKESGVTRAHLIRSLLTEIKRDTDASEAA